MTAGNWQFVKGNSSTAPPERSASRLSPRTNARGADALRHDRSATFLVGSLRMDRQQRRQRSRWRGIRLCRRGNYHEVTVSAMGNAQLRSRIGGVSSTLASATFAAARAH